MNGPSGRSGPGTPSGPERGDEVEAGGPASTGGSASIDRPASTDGRASTGGSASIDRPASTGAPEVVRAAGGIVLRASTTGGWEVALIHRPLQRDWSLPKGKLEPGESLEECALREVREETGCTCALGRFVGEVEYVDRKGRPKVVEYWLMQPIEGDWQQSDEVDELAWVPLAEAPARLSYEHDRDLIVALAGAMGAAGHR